MAQANDKKADNERFASNLSTKLTKILKNQLDYIDESSQETITKKDESFSKDDFSNDFLTNKKQAEIEDDQNEVEVLDGHQTDKSLVSL